MFKKLKKVPIGLLVTLLFMPVLALAQYGGGNELNVFGARIIGFINDVLVPFVFAVSLLVFVYGVYMFFFYQGNTDDADSGRKTGKFYMLWAVIAFVFMVSVWGIVNLLAGGLDLDKKTLDGVIPIASPVTD